MFYYEKLFGMSKAQKRVCLFLILTVGFIDYMGIGLVYPLFSSLIFDKDLSILPETASSGMRGFYLGLLLSLMPITQFFSAPIFGSLSDRKGRRGVLAVSLTIGIFGYLASVIGIHVKSLTILIFSRVLIGASAGSAAVVQAALADISSSKEKAKNFGLYNMALGAGFTLGPFLGGKLSDPNFLGIGSLVLPFWFSFVAILVNIIFVIAYFKETHGAEERAQIRFSEGLKNLQKALHMQGIRTLLLCAFLFSFGWSFFFEFAPVFLIGQYDFHPPDIGNFYAYSGALYALSCGVLIRPIVNKFSPQAVFFWSLILAGAYVLLFLFIENSTILWFYVPFLLFLVALVYPTVTAMISNWAGKKMQGETLGVLQSVQSVAFALSPLFSGTLIGNYLFMPVVIGGASMLMAGVVFGIFLISVYLYK